MYNEDGKIIANTYPVFKKAMVENQQGYYISEELSEIQRNKYKLNSTYFSEFNKALNEFVKNCYIEFEPYEDVGLIFFYDDNYYYTLLEVDEYTILLNYDADGKNILNLIPFVSNYKSHVKDLVYNHKEYKVTNTYFSFLNFTDNNGLPQVLDSNKEFFGSFLNSIANEDLNKDLGKLRIIKELNSKLDGKFKYVILENDNYRDKNIIIIVDYDIVPRGIFQEVEDDDIPF